MEWKITDQQVPYEDALSFMEERVKGIHECSLNEMVWLLEHPPLYTAGTSANEEDMLNARFPVYQAGRGGEYTYHGPGQRVGYVMLDLKRRQKVPDIKKFVWQLEEWIIKSLQPFDIKGERRNGRIGIWVDTPKGELKIAALGIRIRHWITFHGVSINVNPDLSHFNGINPCGIKEYGVTSLQVLKGNQLGLKELDESLKLSWDEVFEPPLSFAA
jgi:lipoyl(octanoyl) transferase